MCPMRPITRQYSRAGGWYLSWLFISIVNAMVFCANFWTFTKGDLPFVTQSSVRLEWFNAPNIDLSHG